MRPMTALGKEIHRFMVRHAITREEMARRLGVRPKYLGAITRGTAASAALVERWEMVSGKRPMPEDVEKAWTVLLSGRRFDEFEVRFRRAA